jgi:MFS family permease
LVAHGKGDQARRVLARVRSGPAEIDAELMDIRAAGAVREAGWSALRAAWVRPALLAGLGIAVFAQVTGINAVVYYAPTILSGAGLGRSTALLATVGVGLVETVCTAGGALIVDRLGRRRLMLWMLPGAAVSLFALGAVFAFAGAGGASSWLLIGFMLLYMAFNSCGLQVVAWLIGSEIFPLSVRGKAMSAHAVTLWSADLLVSLTALSLVNSLGAAWTMCLYGVLNVAGWLFVARRVPETGGRSLEEIETQLRAGAFRPGAVPRQTPGRPDPLLAGAEKEGR